MSEESTKVGAEHFRYIAGHTVREDAFLAELKKAAAAAGIPPIWIAPEQASFMQILLRAAGAREVVEVGTLAGYSAHADRDDLTRFITRMRHLPRVVRLVHGERAVREAFADHLRAATSGRVEVIV